MRKAERKAREATHRVEELKWRIDGRGIRPRPLPGCRSTEVSEEKGKRKNERASAQDRARSHPAIDRKSTRLNSSHANISYAVFCLKKKKKNNLSKRSAFVIFLHGLDFLLEPSSTRLRLLLYSIT